MKLFLGLLFCFISLTSYSYPKLETININEKYFGAYFDYYNSVTLFLEKDKHSCCHESAYSVKGWYQFKNSNKRVELVGVYYLGELYLYNLNEKKSIEFLEGYDGGASGVSNFWDDMMYYKSLPNYNEKLIIKNEGASQICIWKKSSLVQTIDLHFPQNLSVSQTYNYLHLSKNKSIHLDNIVSLIAPNFKIIAFSKDKSRVVLEFDSMPRSYVMG